MAFLQKYGYYLIILAIISEVALPFILAQYYPGYTQVDMLISTFGENGVPTQDAFKIWEVINGTLFVLGAPYFYQRFQGTNERLAFWLMIMVIIFGVGDCIITGVVDRATTTEQISFSSYLHNYASGAGFVALLAGTFILIKLYHLERNHTMLLLLPIIFVIAMVFMFLFAMPKIPIISQFQISHRGLWQRLNLYFLYLPYLLVSIGGLAK